MCVCVCVFVCVSVCLVPLPWAITLSMSLRAAGNMSNSGRVGHCGRGWSGLSIVPQDGAHGGGRGSLAHKMEHMEGGGGV